MKTEINSSNVDPNSFKGWNNEIKDKENNVILRKSNQKRFIQYNPKTGKITVKTLNFFEKFLRTVGLFGYDKYRSSKYIHSLKEGKILTDEQSIKKAEIRQKTDDAWKAYFNRGGQEQTSSTRSSSESEDEQTTEKKKSERQKSEQKSSEEKLPKELQSYEVNLDDKESSSLEKLLQQLLDHGDHQNLKCLELVEAIGKKMGPKITPNKESLYLNINYDNLLLQALKERKWNFAKSLIQGYSNHSNDFSIPNLFESIFKEWYGNIELVRDPEFGLSKDFFFSIVDQYFTEEHFKVDQKEGKIAPHFLLFLYRYGRPEWKSDKVLKLISMLAEKSNIGYSSGRYMYADYYYVQKYIGVKQPYVKAFCEGYFKREDSFRNIRLIALDLVRKRPDEAFYQWFWDLSSTLKPVDSGFNEFFLFYSAVQASEDNQTSMDIWKKLMQDAEESDLKSTYQFNDQEKYTLLEYCIRYGKNAFAKDIVDALIKKGDTSNHIIESIARQWPTSESLYTYYANQQKLIPNDLLFKLLQTDMPKNKSYEPFISFLLKQSDLSKIHDEIAKHPVTLDSYLNNTISLPKSLNFALSLLTQTNIYSFTTTIQDNIHSYFTSPEANAALGAYALSDPSQLTNAQPLSIIKKNCELVLTPKSTYWDFNKMVRLLSSVLTDKTAQQFSPFISSQKDQWDLINHLYGLAKNNLSTSQHLEFIKYCVDLKSDTNEKLDSNFSDSIKQVSEKDFNKLMFTIATNWPNYQMVLEKYLDAPNATYDNVTFKVLHSALAQKDEHKAFVFHLIDKSTLSKVKSFQPDSSFSVEGTLSGTFALPEALKLAFVLLIGVNISRLSYPITNYLKDQFPSQDINAILGSYILRSAPKLTELQPVATIEKNCTTILSPKSTDWTFKRMVSTLSEKLSDKSSIESASLISNPKDQLALINYLYSHAKNDLSASQHLEFIKYCVDLKGATNEKLDSNFSDSIKQVSEKDFNKLMFTIATNWPNYQMVLEKYLDATNATYDDVTLKVLNSALAQKDEHKAFVFHLIEKSTLSKVKGFQPDSSFSVEGTLSDTFALPEALKFAFALLTQVNINRLSYLITNYLKDQFPSPDIKAILGSYILRSAPKLKDVQPVATIEKNCTTILSPKSTDWTFKKMVNTLSDQLSDKSSIESASLISNPKDKLALINYLYSHAKDGLSASQHLEFIRYYVDLKGDPNEKLKSNFSDSVKKMSEKNANKLLLTIATNWPKYQMVLEKYLEVTEKSYNEVSINALKQNFPNEKKYTDFVMHLVEKSDLLNIEKHLKVTQFDLSAALEKEFKESDDIPLIITLINEVELIKINYDIRSKIKESITSDNAKMYITVHMLKKNMKNVDTTSISRIDNQYQFLLDKERYDSDFLTIVNDLANKSLDKKLYSLIYKVTKQISSEKDKLVLINWLYKMGLKSMTTKEHLSLVNYVFKHPNHNDQVLQSNYEHAILQLPVEENLIFKREKRSQYDEIKKNLFEEALSLKNESLLKPLREAIKSANLDKNTQLLNVLSSFIAYGSEETYLDDYLNLFSLTTEELFKDICNLEEFKPSQLKNDQIEAFYKKLINKAVSKDAVTLPESFNVRKDANSEKVSETLETLFTKKNKDERFNTALRNFFKTIEGKRTLYLLSYERKISTTWKSILDYPKPNTSNELTRWIGEEDTFSHFRLKDCEEIHKSIKTYLNGEVSQQAIEHSLWKVIGKMHSSYLLKGKTLEFAYEKSTSLVELFIDKMNKIPLRHDFSTHKLNNPIDLFDYFDVFTCILNNAKTQDKDYKKFLTEIAIKLLESKKLTNESALPDEELYTKLFEKLQESGIEVPEDIKQSYLKD